MKSYIFNLKNLNDVDIEKILNKVHLFLLDKSNELKGMNLYDWDITVYPISKQVLLNREVFIVAATEAGKRIAKNIHKKIASIFDDNGLKYEIDVRVKKRS